jgi:DNA-binding Lrp family transcriptional regulator
VDELDRRILEALENAFPLSERPYDTIADKLEIPVDRFYSRVQELLADGVIRRMGASLDSRKLGFSSTLAAVSVGSERVEQAAEMIGGFAEVTHSYLRNDRFNIWFTIIAIDNERIEQILEHIGSRLSLDSSQVLNLPVKRLFKLDARFSGTS